MLNSILPLLLLILFAWIWFNELKAHESACRLSRELCHNLGWQLLDYTVSLRRIVLRRNGQNQWRIRRSYDFELSTDGTDRHSASLNLFDGALHSYSLPTTLQATANFLQPILPQG